MAGDRGPTQIHLVKNPLPKILTPFAFASAFAVETRGTRLCASSLIRRGACIALLPTLFFLALTGAGSAAIIQASDGSAGDTFGGAVSVSGNSSLVGAPYDDNRGSAYVFRNLDTAGGTVTQSVKLIASQRVDFDDFGAFVSLSGSIGLVGNPSYSLGGKRVQGAAYLFRNLNTATGTITQTAKLLASNSAAEDFFGTTVSVSGNIGVIGGLGKAWLFRNLDTATGTVTEAARLTSTDGAVGSSGFITSVSGNAALIGSEKANSFKGAAYLFRNLDAATGTVTQTAKLTASDGAVGDSFGWYSSLSGNIG